MSLGVNPFAKRKPIVGQIGKNKEPTIRKGSPINVNENNKAKWLRLGKSLGIWTWTQKCVPSLMYLQHI